MPKVELLAIALFILCERYVVSSPFGQSQCPNTPLTSCVNDLGLQLFSRMNAEERNLCLSPYSVFTAMAMAREGAGGSSAQQLDQALGLQSHQISGQNLGLMMEELTALYENPTGECDVNAGNAIFIQDGFPVKDHFANAMNTYYHAGGALVDFAQNPQEARQEINRNVAECTYNKVTEMITQPVDPNTKMLLANALYFNGVWKNQFNPEDTGYGAFYKTIDERKEANYMNMYDVSFPFYEDLATKYKFLEMPYAEDKYSMLVALPGSIQAKPCINLTSSSLCDVRSKLVPQRLERVSIPKFRAEYNTDFAKPLQTLGITDIFTPSADFSGISDSSGLVVSSVNHRAIAEVDERGSEVAAASALQMANESPASQTFICDHPFAYYVVDKRNGMLLCCGALSDP